MEIQTVTEPLMTESNLTITVHPVNDNPILMLLERGYDVIPPSFSVDLTVEQNRETLTIKNDLTMLWVTYDIDPDDVLDIQIQQGQNGILNLTSVVTDVDLVEQNCKDEWTQRARLWERLEEELWGGEIPVHLPIPCGLDGAALDPSTQWAILQGRYTPDDDFHWVDTIKVWPLT